MQQKKKRRRAPTPKEYEDQITFVQAVKLLIKPEWRFTHLPMGEYRDIKTAMKLLRMGVMPGWPDFIFTGPRAVVFIELKRRGVATGSIPSHQDDMRDHLTRCGFNYLVTSDINDALGTLTDIGALRPAQVQ